MTIRPTIPQHEGITHDLAEAAQGLAQPYTKADLEQGKEIVRELHGLRGFDAWAERIAKAIAAAREAPKPNANGACYCDLSKEECMAAGHPVSVQQKSSADALTTDEAASIGKSLRDAEPRRGVPMVLQARPGGTTLPFTAVRMGKRVRKLRDKLKLPETFTLDACRHGGMTELEEAELTDGQGRALSGHRTQRAYEGYAKRTLQRALPGTRKRHAHRIATTAAEQLVADRKAGKATERVAAPDKARTNFRNGTRTEFRNELADKG